MATKKRDILCDDTIELFSTVEDCISLIDISGI